MKLSSSVFLTLYTVFIFYSFLNIFFSEKGYFEKEKLSSYKAELVNNINDLEQKKNKLLVTYESLLQDSEVIELNSRNIGYLRENEGFIVVKNKKSSSRFYEIGTILNNENNAEDNAKLFRIMSLFIALFLFPIIMLVSKKRVET